MKNCYDLHSHTVYSDGACSPAELVELAYQQEVKTLAITDHDTIDGLAEARSSALSRGIELIPGVEISVRWREIDLHLLGLNIDVSSTLLQSGLSRQQAARQGRAQLIAQELEKLHIENPYEKVQQLAKNAIIGRRHFADLLIQEGFAKDLRSVFKHFLVPGKPGYVSIEWVSLNEAVQWIRQAGGIAAIAHPTRYKLSTKRLKQLLAEFKEMGGEALEVATPNLNAQQLTFLTGLCQAYDLLASQGSDYHGADATWQVLGKFPPLPPGSVPVWTKF